MIWYQALTGSTSWSLQVLAIFAQAPELCELIAAVEEDYTRVLQHPGRRPEGPYAELLPFLAEQAQDWEAAATATTTANPPSPVSSPLTVVYVRNSSACFCVKKKAAQFSCRTCRHLPANGPAFLAGAVLVLCSQGLRAPVTCVGSCNLDCCSRMIAFQGTVLRHGGLTQRHLMLLGAQALLELSMFSRGPGGAAHKASKALAAAAGAGRDSLLAEVRVLAAAVLPMRDAEATAAEPPGGAAAAPAEPLPPVRVRPWKPSLSCANNDDGHTSCAWSNVSDLVRSYALGRMARAAAVSSQTDGGSCDTGPLQGDGVWAPQVLLIRQRHV